MLHFEILLIFNPFFQFHGVAKKNTVKHRTFVHVDIFSSMCTFRKSTVHLPDVARSVGNHDFIGKFGHFSGVFGLLFDFDSEFTN